MPASFLLFTPFIFLIGLMVGSFLNVLIDRPNIDQSPFKGRSHCDFCSHTLSWIDLIPVLSFFALKGRCRYCKKQLSNYYPLTEIITASFFTIAYIIAANLNSDLQSYPIEQVLSLLYHFLIVSILIVIFFTDLKYGIIPFKAVVIGVIATVLWHLYSPTPGVSLSNYIYAGVGSFASFLLLFLGTKGRGIGFGDVVFAFFMGILLGFPNIILGFYIAFLSGAIISIILIMAKKKKMRGSTIPFGPFLVSGTIISLFWGELLVNNLMAYLLK